MDMVATKLNRGPEHENRTNLVESSYHKVNSSCLQNGRDPRPFFQPVTFVLRLLERSPLESDHWSATATTSQMRETTG